LLEAMRHDKKVSGGEIRFVLAHKIGQVSLGQPVPPELIEQVLAEAGAAEPAVSSVAASNPCSPR
jgi:3-dehydroquinate synthetase